MSKFSEAYLVKLGQSSKAAALPPPLPPPLPTAPGLLSRAGSIVGAGAGKVFPALGGYAYADLGLNAAGFGEQAADSNQFKQFARSALPGAVGGAAVGKGIGAGIGAIATSGYDAYSKNKDLNERIAHAAKPVIGTRANAQYALDHGNKSPGVIKALAGKVVDDASLEAGNQIGIQSGIDQANKQNQGKVNMALTAGGLGLGFGGLMLLRNHLQNKKRKKQLLEYGIE